MKHVGGLLVVIVVIVEHLLSVSIEGVKKVMLNLQVLIEIKEPKVALEVRFSPSDHQVWHYYLML